MPSPLTHSTLTQLIVKFAMSFDGYNSSDLSISTPSTVVDTTGERARVCINLALHQIYSLIKDSKYLEAYPVSTLSSSPNQDFINLDPEAFLDDIESVSDETNQYSLEQKSWSWYKRNVPDPAQVTGDPLYYIRRGDRVYLTPRPTSTINYTISFRKLTVDLKLGGDMSLLPVQYDTWIIAESIVKWYVMEDPSSVPALVISERDDTRAAGLASVNTSFDRVMQSGSHFAPDHGGMYPWRRPIPST